MRRCLLGPLGRCDWSGLRTLGLILVSISVSFESPLRAQQIGTDIAVLNLCLYGDCEARGAYAADPFGFANPGTLPVGMLAYVPRGVAASGSYFHLSVGGIGINVGSPSVTVGMDPWVVEFNVVYAEGGGFPKSVPGVDLSLRTRLVRLAAAVDLGRTQLGWKGLSIGLLAGVPGTTSDVHLTARGLTLVDAQETHEIGLTPGLDWRAGQHDWFSVGVFVDAERHHESDTFTDPATLSATRRSGTSNAWFVRAGVSVLPFEPLAVSNQAALAAPVDELLRALRFAADVEYRNISALGETTRKQETGYFGIDTRLLPDAWNPVSSYLRLYLISGIDTDKGWGVGAGLYGNGILEFLSCNPAYSSRPRAESLGDRLNVWSATCAVAVPL